MAKVISGYLTSVISAHSAIAGDQIINSQGDREEVVQASRRQRPGWRPYVEIFLAELGTYHPVYGYGPRKIRKILCDPNHPLNRVTGARNGGII